MIMSFLKRFSLTIFVLSLTLRSTKSQTNLNSQGSHNDIKNKIQEWWKENNNQVKRNCLDHKPTLPKLPFQGARLRLRIRGYNCLDNTNPSLYLFNGSNKSHYPEGKGKLRLVSETEWSTWPDSEKNAFFERNICYEMMGIKNSEVDEIIGSFKNGSLEGTSKIRFQDNTTFISKFKDGYLHGFLRSWNRNGSLLIVENYKKGVEFGKRWSIVMDHLLYLNADILNAKEKHLSVVFPILTNGSLDDPMLGTFLPHLNVLDDVHDVQITGIDSKTEDCILKISYKKMKKKNYRYILRNKSKFPVDFHKNAPFCKDDSKTSLYPPSQKLHDMFEYVDSLIYGNIFSANQTFFEGCRILWHLKPPAEEVDEVTALRLISNITINETTRTVTAVILGSERPLELELYEFHLNKRLELHGYCDIGIAAKDRLGVPRDNAVDWPPYRIKGMFYNGKLNGIAIIETDTQSFGWVTMKDNVIHGPVVFQGIMPVNPVK